MSQVEELKQKIAHLISGMKFLIGNDAAILDNSNPGEDRQGLLRQAVIRVNEEVRSSGTGRGSWLGLEFEQIANLIEGYLVENQAERQERALELELEEPIPSGLSSEPAEPFNTESKLSLIYALLQRVGDLAYTAAGLSDARFVQWVVADENNNPEAYLCAVHLAGSTKRQLAEVLKIREALSKAFESNLSFVEKVEG